MSSTPRESPAQAGPWRTIPALLERLNDGTATPSFTPDSLRWYLRQSRNNGLEQHVRRLGKKLLINEPGFLRWLESQPSRWDRGAA